MNSPDLDEFRNLLIKLSAGQCTSDDKDRLNEILKRDEACRDLYLNHVMIDGLLEREFQGADLSEYQPAEFDGFDEEQYHDDEFLPRRGEFWKSSTKRVAVLAALLLSVTVGLVYYLTQANQTQHVLLLTNAGFESQKVSDSDQLLIGHWQGEAAHFVEQVDELAPIEGRRMLQFHKDPSVTESISEVYQLVDLRPHLDLLAENETFVEASAFFNSLESELESEDCGFGITVYACSEMPTTPFTGGQNAWPRWIQNFVGSSGRRIVADTDSETWQQVDTSLPLPPETQFLVVKLTVVRNDMDKDLRFPGQFADNVDLRLICQK